VNLPVISPGHRDRTWIAASTAFEMSPSIADVRLMRRTACHPSVSSKLIVGFPYW
jgi:hypothetical protein